MLATIKWYWAALPASIAGPAFIAAGVWFAISDIFNFLVPNSNPPTPDVLGYLLAFLHALVVWLIPTSANLALLAGLAAIYKRWAMALDSLGKLGMLLAAIGIAVAIIVDLEWLFGGLIE